MGWDLPGKDASITRTIFFNINPISNQSLRRVRTVNTNGNFRFNFHIPSDYKKMVTCGLVGEAGGIMTSVTADLSSEYGKIGEQFNAGSENQALAPITDGASGEKVFLDISQVMTGVEPFDSGGVLIEHNAIGGNIHYDTFFMEYSVVR